jgi:hypothetical protein
LVWDRPLLRSLFGPTASGRGRTKGFVDAMRHALGAYLRFAGAHRLQWAPDLAAERQLFPELTG